MTTSPASPDPRGPANPLTLPTHTAPIHAMPPPHAPVADWHDLSAKLRRVALALCRDSNHADDLAQETLARLLSRSTTTASAAAVLDREAYAITTLTRLWLASERSLRRRLSHLRTLALVRSARALGRLSAAPNLELAERLDAAVAELPAQQRAALILRLVAGLDYAAIAVTLHSTVPAVRANLHLARAKLRPLLADTPEDRP